MRVELTREQERKLVERTINHFTNNLFNFGEYWNCRTFETHKAKITWYSGTGNSFYIASKELNVDFNLYDEKTEIGHIKDLVKFCQKLYDERNNILTEENTDKYFDEFFGE